MKHVDAQEPDQTGLIGFNAEFERARREREHWSAEQRRIEAEQLLEQIYLAQTWHGPGDPR
ncbi:hypothetical protein [Amycolatopsis cihanbeyliensis]|uniref:Uncharacterized protein n=1 Tax=Amycolatopsis cihanbeyliensis TaxID=1128664 RepID=A0A542DHT3_AMYCI|nr:hypothetical protein [Amycolatopsis cihanbeyliensis]TQJ02595.1 hypothetical protein FB471_2328 [Amycolatopsis cihanbeyliensis]